MTKQPYLRAARVLDRRQRLRPPGPEVRRPPPGPLAKPDPRPRQLAQQAEIYHSILQRKLLDPRRTHWRYGWPPRPRGGSSAYQSVGATSAGGAPLHWVEKQRAARPPRDPQAVMRPGSQLLRASDIRVTQGRPRATWVRRSVYVAQARHGGARARRQRRGASDDARAGSCAPPWREARLNEGPRRRPTKDDAQSTPRGAMTSAFRWPRQARGEGCSRRRIENAQEPVALRLALGPTAPRTGRLAPTSTRWCCTALRTSDPGWLSKGARTVRRPTWM
jgi:hypothetical protein